MTSEIERLASTLECIPYTDSLGGGDSFDIENPRVREAIVRALLTAMREPSEEAVYDFTNISNPRGGRLILHRQEATAIIHAYLDHILSPTVEGEGA